MRQNWIPIVQSKSGSAAHAANHNPNPLEPAETALISVTAYRLKSRKIPNPTPSRPDRRRPGKPPIQRRPGRTAAGRENPQTKSRLVLLLLLLLLLLSSPHGKAGSAGKEFRAAEIGFSMVYLKKIEIFCAARANLLDFKMNH